MPDLEKHASDAYEDYEPPFERDIMQDTAGFREQENDAGLDKKMLPKVAHMMEYSTAEDLRREALNVAAQVITSTATGVHTDPFEVITLASDIERYLSEGAVPGRAAQPDDPA